MHVLHTLLAYVQRQLTTEGQSRLFDIIRCGDGMRRIGKDNNMKCHHIGWKLFMVEQLRVVTIIGSQLFCSIDASANDLPWHETVDTYPTLVFYPAHR